MGAAENAVQEPCLRLLKHWPGVRLSGRTNNSATFDGHTWRKFRGIPGFADGQGLAPIGVFPKGGMLAVEFKAPGEKPSEDQVKYLRAVADSGNTAVVTDDIGLFHAVLEKRMEPGEDGVYYALAGKKIRKT